MDLESTNGEAAAPNSEDTQKSYTKHKENYENLRSVVAVKLQFLDENRVTCWQLNSVIRPKILIQEICFG